VVAGAERARLVEFWERQRAAMHAMKVDGDCAAAIPHFRAALAIKPEHEDSLYYLANCLATQGDLSGAGRTLEQLTRINPSSHRAHARLGVLRALTAATPEDLAEATALLERAVAINPEETGALLALGEVFLLRGDPSAAEQRLSLANRTNPKAAGGYFLRAYIAWKQGDAARSRELLSRARGALGPEWKPKGMTSEGDVRAVLHEEKTPLSRFWESWDGTSDPALAFSGLDRYLRSR
jgi:tetratricopeptide (TPR) repeat protein